MKTKSGFSIPVRTRIFHGMSRVQVEDLLTALGAVSLTYTKGETILREWSPITDYYLVSSVSALSFYTRADGRRSVTGSYGQGDVFGLLFAFSDIRMNPSSVISTDETTVIRIPIVDIVHNGLLISTEVRRRYVQNAVNSISQSAFDARLRAFVMANSTVEGRIAAYLNETAKHTNSSEFDIPFNRQELADFIDCDRSTLCTALGNMKRKGLVDFHKNSFRIVVPFE